MERLKGVDASFLYMETPKTQFHVTFAAVANPKDMAGGYSFHKIMDLIGAKAANEPAFRRRLVHVPFKLHHPLWIDDPDFDIIHHVRQVALPKPGGAQEFGEMIGRIQSTPLDRSRALWEFWVIEGLRGGRLAFVLKMHHASVDGVSGAGLLMQLLEKDRNAPLPPPAPPRVPDPIPSSVELIAYALRSRAKDPDRFFKLAAQSIQGVLEIMEMRKSGDKHPGGTPLQAPPTHFNQAVSARRNLAIARLPLEEVKAIKDRLDGTVNDVVLAVCGGALRHYLEERGELPRLPLTAVCPISIRTKEEAGMKDNRVSAMWTSLGTDIADPVARLREIHEFTDGAKEEHNAVGAHLLQEWAELAAPSTFSLAVRFYSERNFANKHRPVHNLVVSNVPGPRFPLFLAGAEIEAIYPMGPVMEGAGLNITVMSYLDAMDFSLLVDAKLMPDVWKLAELIPVAFAELAEAAGVTIAPAKSPMPGSSGKARPPSVRAGDSQPPPAPDRTSSLPPPPRASSPTSPAEGNGAAETAAGTPAAKKRPAAKRPAARKKSTTPPIH